MIELLLSLILAITGIARDVDPGLTAIAERRAAETATDATFSHDGMDPCCYEVLAWNLGHPDLEAATRRAVEQWRGSPTHWEILTNASLTRIGCGHAVGQDGRDSFACVLAPGYDQPAVEPVGAARSPKPTPAGSTPAGGASNPAPVVTTLPDTAAAGVDRSKHFAWRDLWTALYIPV